MLVTSPEGRHCSDLALQGVGAGITYCAAMIKIARAVCHEACCHQRHSLACRRPLRAYSHCTLRTNTACSSAKQARTRKAVAKVPELKAGVGSRATFACNSAVMDKPTPTSNPLLVVKTAPMYCKMPSTFGILTTVSDLPVFAMSGCMSSDLSVRHAALAHQRRLIALSHASAGNVGALEDSPGSTASF